MRAEACQGCQDLRASDNVCLRKGVPVSKIRGCSRCPAGRRFFRSKSGAEAFRVNVLGKRKESMK